MLFTNRGTSVSRRMIKALIGPGMTCCSDTSAATTLLVAESSKSDVDGVSWRVVLSPRQAHLLCWSRPTLLVRQCNSDGRGLGGDR